MCWLSILFFVLPLLNFQLFVLLLLLKCPVYGRCRISTNIINFLYYMKHYTDDQIAKYLNTYVVPQDLKIRKMILSGQLDKNGEAMVYIRLRRYDPATGKDVNTRWNFTLTCIRYDTAYYKTVLCICLQKISLSLCRCLFSSACL